MTRHTPVTLVAGPVLALAMFVAVSAQAPNNPRVEWIYDYPDTVTEFRVCFATADANPGCQPALGGGSARSFSLSAIPAGNYTVTLAACNGANCSAPTDPIAVGCPVQGACFEGSAAPPRSPAGSFFFRNDEPEPPGTGITRVQVAPFVSTGFVDSARLSFAANVSAGNLLVLFVTTNVPIASVKDVRVAGGDNWVRAVETSVAGQHAGIWYVQDAKPGQTSVVVDMAGTGGALASAVAVEYAGVVTSGALLNVAVRNLPQSKTPATQPIVSTLPHELLVAALSCPNSEANWDPNPAQFNIARRDISNGGFMVVSADDQLVTPGEHLFSWTLGAAYPCDVIAARFKGR